MNLVYDRKLDVTPKKIEFNCTHWLPEAEVINNKRLRSRYCTVEANYRQTRSIARPLCDSRASCSEMIAIDFWPNWTSCLIVVDAVVTVVVISLMSNNSS